MYTMTKELQRHMNRKQICAILDRLSQGEMIYRMAGNCLGACDIIQKMLSAVGIDSKIVECQASVIRTEGEFQDFFFVGYDNLTGDFEGMIDTHVVIVTNTEPPVLIDAALGDAVSEDNRIVVGVLEDLDPDVIGEFTIDNTVVTYTVKQRTRLPELHQKNLVERILDQKAQTKRTIFVSRFLWIIAGLTAINIIANTMLLTMKWFGH